MMSHSDKQAARYYVGPVVGVQVYKNDVVVIRKGAPPPQVDVERGDIVEFSRKARQRLAFIAANTQAVFRTFYHLTYPNEYPTDGAKVKRDLQCWLSRHRRQYPKAAYLWFLEFQTRGAPHIHFASGHPWPKDKEARRALRLDTSDAWYRIVGSGDEKHLRAGTRVERVRVKDGAARYAVKEMCKMYQKLVPEGYRNVGRFYGYSRDVPPTPRAELRCTEDDIRGVLEGWAYAPASDRTLYHVLYGVSALFLPDHKE